VKWTTEPPDEPFVDYVVRCEDGLIGVITESTWRRTYERGRERSVLTVPEIVERLEVAEALLHRVEGWDSISGNEHTGRRALSVGLRLSVQEFNSGVTDPEEAAPLCLLRSALLQGASRLRHLNLLRARVAELETDLSAAKDVNEQLEALASEVVQSRDDRDARIRRLLARVEALEGRCQDE
jgi:hypothetical protein